MTMAEAREPIFDFRVISDLPEGASQPDRRPGQGEWDETVWMPDGEWGHGDELGTVAIRAIGKPGSPEFIAQFTFTDPAQSPGPTTVKGSVPGGDTWVGKGKAKASGPKPEKDVDIEFKNPKGWG
jgi:hypothetical protein